MTQTLRFFTIILWVFVLFACNSNPTKDNAIEIASTPKALKERITRYEDSLASMDPSKQSPAAYNLCQIELINRLEFYVKTFPQDTYSAECLFKLHMVFAGLNAQQKSVACGDTLLRRFPNYENRSLLLESMASSYDMFITPRDTAAVRKYYTMLLTDSRYPSTKKKEILDRLKHLKLTWIEYAQKKQPKNL